MGDKLILYTSIIEKDHSSLHSNCLFSRQPKMQENEVGQSRDKLHYTVTTQINLNPSLSKGCVSQKKKTEVAFDSSITIQSRY